MSAHARQEDRPAPVTVPEPPAAAPAPVSTALSPQHVIAMQKGAGNTAVSRMLARLIDFNVLAERIHTAVDGIGTDEQAIFDALNQLNRDPAQIDQLIAAYKGRYGDDLITVLKDELSGTELQNAMFLLRRGPSPGMEAVSAEAESMVGSEMKWTGSGPGSGNTFEKWASAASEATAPPVDATTTINCWEMILLAAYRAGQLSWKWIHDQYTAAVGDWAGHMVRVMSRGARIPYTPGAPAGRAPVAGDLVFMDGINHVALATGNVDGSGRAEIISFWPPPNTPFAAGGTLDKVKHTTIEELVDWWTTNMPPAPLVELAAPPWS